MAAVLALLLLGTVGCGSSGGKASGRTVKVEADDFYFKPTDIKLTAGERTTLEIENEGKAEHSMTVDGLAIDHDVEAGKTVRVTITANAGTYRFHCKYHPDKMNGTITVA